MELKIARTIGGRSPSLTPRHIRLMTTEGIKSSLIYFNVRDRGGGALSLKKTTFNSFNFRNVTAAPRENLVDARSHGQFFPPCIVMRSALDQFIFEKMFCRTPRALSFRVERAYIFLKLLTFTSLICNFLPLLCYVFFSFPFFLPFPSFFLPFPPFFLPS